MDWLWIIVALIAGMIIGYWLARRAFEDEATAHSRSTPVAADAAPERAVAAPAEAADVATDDLTKIEGIGPKIAELIAAGGAPTYAALAATPVERLQEILDEAGPRYRVHDPASWPSQAALAAEGNWGELEALQERLDGGRLE